MKKYFFLIPFLVTTLFVKGQWVQQQSNIIDPLHCADFSDENVGWIGGFGLVKTTDGGTNWNPANYSLAMSFYMNSNWIRDIKTFNASKMIGVGKNNISNASVIVTTLDGGVVWDTIVGRSGYGYNSIDFSTPMKGYICGYYGQFFETIDGGITWTQASLIPNTDWYKINFQNQDTAIVVGYNYSMRTYNGGAAWISTPNSLILYDVIALVNNTCIAIGDDVNGDYCLFKSYDYGNNWIKITSIPFDETYVKRIWAFSEDSILLPSKGIMNSYRNGFWHSYPSTQLINTSNEFEDVDFVNDTVGYAVGNNGQLYKTVNAFGDEAPYAFFTPDTLTVCENDSIFFTNNSETGLFYEWYQNGIQVSNSYSPYITFNNPGTDTVSLVVDNGTYRDTSFSVVNIFAKPIINSFVLQASYDSICQRYASNIYVLNSQTGVSYQLYKDSILFGNPKNGNGNNLLFNSGNLDTSTHFMVIANDTNQCGTTHDTVYTAVYVYPNLDPNTQFLISDTTPCMNDSLIITFPNSDPSIQYLMSQTIYPGGTHNAISKYGNGGNLEFLNQNIRYDIFYQFLVKNSHNCIDTLYQTQQVLLDSAIADFDIATNSMVGDTIFTTNNSVGATYQWGFGNNTTPSQSILTNPFTISDSAYMSNPVQMIVTAPFGCTDTLTQLINIFDVASTGSGSYCYVDTLPFHYGLPEYSARTENDRVMLDQHTDNNGNTYMCGYFADVQQNGGSRIPNYFITKIDPNGNIVWDKFQTLRMYIDTSAIGLHWSDYMSSIATCITSDCKGNVYVGGQIRGSAIFLPDTVINFQLMYGTNGPEKISFLFKFDTLGNTEWGRYTHLYGNSSAGFPKGISDVVYVDDNHIYYHEFRGSTNQINSDGQLIRGRNIVAATHASNDGMNIHNMETWNNGGFVITGPKLSKMNNGDFLISANYSRGVNSVDMAGNQLSLTSFHTINSLNGYSAIIDKDSLRSKGFYRTYGLDGFDSDLLIMKSKVSVDYYNNIYVVINYKINPDYDFSANSSVSLKIGNGIELTGYHFNTSVLVKYDVLGNYVWHNKLTSSEVVDIEVADSSVYLLGNFDGIIGASSQNGEVNGVKSSGKEMFISSHDLNGNLNWINVVGNSKNAFAHAMDVTPCGDIYFSGKAESTIYFDGDSIASDSNLFVGKYSISNSCASNSCQYFVGGSSCMSGNSYCSDSKVNIKWCSYGDSGFLDISYSLDSGVTNTTIVQNYSSTNIGYQWNAPSNIFVGQWCLLTVQNPNNSSVLDSIWIYLEEPPLVDLDPFTTDTICKTNTIIQFPLGTPAGGTYSGLGQSNVQFNPLAVDTGYNYLYYTYADANGCSSTDSSLVYISLCVGIDEYTNGYNIVVYPNPNSGQFVIEKPENLNEQVNFKLLDITSRIIKEGVIPIGQQKVEMDITNYSKGVYYLQLTVNGEVFVKQVLKN